MSGRRKFSDLEASMSPGRRARIERLAERLGHQLDSAASQPERQLREAVLQLLENHPAGLTRDQILQQLRFAGSKSDERSVAHVLRLLARAKKVAAREEIYIPA